MTEPIILTRDDLPTDEALETTHAQLDILLYGVTLESDAEAWDRIFGDTKGD